jgi:uncharacterized protein (TIGR02996 family)
MTTLDDLLRAVLADPADDGARLAYADWLEEEGQTERAEFVRVQVALAVETRKTYQVRLKRRLKQMCRGVVTLRRWTWTNYVLDDLGWGLSINGWPFCVVPVVPHATFRRGFVESVTCSCADWLAHGPAVVAAQPVTAVRLADVRPATFIDAPALWQRDMSGVLDGPVYIDEESIIPASIFDLMEGELGMYYFVVGKHGDKRYTSVNAAHAALSAACLKFAREKAALPIASL